MANESPPPHFCAAMQITVSSFQLSLSVSSADDDDDDDDDNNNNNNNNNMY